MNFTVLPKGWSYLRDIVLKKVKHILHCTVVTKEREREREREKRKRANIF